MPPGRVNYAQRYLILTGAAIAVLYLSWFGMMAMHETGHVLAAVLTGGHVQRVILPPLGFSRTDVSPIPHRVIEVWAGPLFGGLLPAAAWLAIGRRSRLLAFFGGFCLVVNGSYLAAGTIERVGDARELLQLGTPAGAPIFVGIAFGAAGLSIWHVLSRRRRTIPDGSAELSD